MKPFNSKTRPIHPTTEQTSSARFGMSAVAAGLVLLSSAPWSAHAQSAANFEIQSKAAKPVAAAEAKDPKEMIKTPSRRVTAEELPAYIRSVSSILSMRNRETDPFGRIQDPNAKPIIKPTVASTRRVAPMQATPFSDIIRMIKVTTIMPGERRFLIGTRSVSQGDRIPLAFRGKNISVEVVSVSSDRIQFRNLESGESAELSLRMLPPGMKPGNDGIHAPGMMADNPNAPIEIESNSLPLNSAQIR